MGQYIIYFLVAAIFIAIFFISIKAAMTEARQAGASDERIKEKEAEAEKKDKATTEILKEVDPGDTEKELDEGIF